MELFTSEPSWAEAELDAPPSASWDGSLSIAGKIWATAAETAVLTNKATDSICLSERDRAESPFSSPDDSASDTSWSLLAPFGSLDCLVLVGAILAKPNPSLREESLQRRRKL